MPIDVYVATEPGGEFEDDQVVFTASVIDRGEVGPVFGIGCDYPPGEYHRHT